MVRRSIVILCVLVAWAAVMYLLLGVVITVLFSTDASDSFAGVLEDLWSVLSFGRDLDPVLGSAVAVLVAAQAVFVLPIVRVQTAAGDRSKSMIASLIVGGLVASLLTVALFLGLLTVPVLFTDGPPGTDKVVVSIFGDQAASEIEWALLGVVALGWLFWSGMLLIYTRQIWSDTALGRLSRVLLAGTVAEIIILIPIDLMVRRKSDCYCSEGSAWSLIASAWALLFLAGPGIMLALTAPKRRTLRRGKCVKCGYLVGPSPSRLCPECGAKQ
jgi:hypothetical protein